MPLLFVADMCYCVFVLPAGWRRSGLYTFVAAHLGHFVEVRQVLSVRGILQIFAYLYVSLPAFGCCPFMVTVPGSHNLNSKNLMPKLQLKPAMPALFHYRLDRFGRVAATGFYHEIHLVGNALIRQSRFDYQYGRAE